MGTLIDSTFENHVGETCRILLDKSGYSGTTYTDDDGTAEATEWRIGRGAPDTTYRIVRQNTNATIGLLVKSSALVNELETVYASDRTFKLTLIRAGTTRFEGWLQSSFVRTQQEPDQPAVIELRGKPQAQMPEASSLEALRDDWVDSNGDRFTGTKTYGPTIASILQRTGLAYDLEAVIHWRPDSMSASDDPLSVQFDTDAFYREGDDGELRVMSAGAVLDDLLGTFNAWVLLREGPVWRIVQSEAFVNGSSVDRWEYDSNGLLKSGQPVSESAVVDISTDVRESDKGDPSKSGLDPIADTRITYEFGPRVGTIDFGGDMENLSSEWKFFDNGTENTLANHPTIEEQTQSAFVRSGSASMRIEGTEVAGGTDPDNFTSAVEDWAQVQITKGSIEPSVKDLQVTLRAIPEVVDDDSDPSTVPNEARAFWGLRFLPLDSAKENQWWILPPNPSGVLGWKKKSNLSQGEKYNFLEDQNFDGGNFIEGRFPIDSVPSTGTLELRLYNPVSEPGTGYTLHANWDDAEFSRNTGSAPKLTSRFQNQSISTGETAERTHRVGTGPRDDSVGGLLDDQGNVAKNWSVIGESQNRTIQGLSNLRLIRLRELPRETWEPTVVQPSTEPVPGKAIVDGSTRYWPLLVESLQPDNAFRLKLAELTLGASTLDEKTVDGASVSDVETERVVSTLTGLDDTQISSLQDGKSVQYDSGKGAFVLGGSKVTDGIVKTDSAAAASTRTERANAVQDAINRALGQNKSIVMVLDKHLNYDASQVTFDSSVRMITEGQQVLEYNAKAYGADRLNSDDSTDAFKAAISQAGADESVRVPAGSYQISDTLEIKPGQTFHGDGNSATFLNRADGSALTGYDMQGVKNGDKQIHPLLVTDPTVNPSNKITIRDLQIQMNTSGTSGQSPQSEAGIAVYQAQDTTIQNCVVEDVRDDLTSTDITNNYRAMCVLITEARRTHVESGTYNKAGYEVIGIRAGSNYTKVEGVRSQNVTDNNGRHTIQASDFNTTVGISAPKNTLITECILDGDRSRVISDNSVTFQVIDNQIRNTVNAPVEVLTRGGATDNEGNTSVDVVISNNDINATTAAGIRARSIDQGDQVTNKDISITSNTIIAEGQGMLLEDIENTTITGNQIRSNAANGIRIDNEITTSTKRISVRGNEIESNDASNANGVGAAVSIGSVERVDVVNNQQKFGRVGVRVDSGASSCIIAQNDLIAAQNTAVDNQSSASDIIIRENRTSFEEGNTHQSKLAHNLGTSSSGTAHRALETSGSLRWQEGLVNSENGSNSGSDWILWRYDDNGNFLSAVLQADRASGDVQVEKQIGIGGISPTRQTDVDGALRLRDSSTSPGTNGVFRLNGVNVEIMSGGAVRNLSNIAEELDDLDDVTISGASKDDQLFYDGSNFIDRPIHEYINQTDTSNNPVYNQTTLNPGSNNDARLLTKSDADSLYGSPTTTDHSISDHDDDTIEAAGTQAGHLVFTDGSNWSSEKAVSPPNDGEVPVWDNANSRYKYESRYPSVQDDGSTIVTNADVIDFADADFVVTNPTGDQAQIGMDPSGFAGTGLEDDGSGNLRINSTAAGDGLQGGSGSALAVDVSNFAGTGLQDDGSENLELDSDYADLRQTPGPQVFDGEIQFGSVSEPGTSSDPFVKLGNSGAGFYVNSNGEVAVRDTSGNTTVIS